MFPKIINSGICSYGLSGRVFHAPFIQGHPGFNLSAIVERSKKSAKKIYPDIISYDTIEEMMDDKSLELIIVNTPNHLHFEHAMNALKKGKHVLIEKPATPTVEQLQELYRTADKLKLQVLIFQNRRWDSDFNIFRTIINSGQLGKLSEVHIRYDRYIKDNSPKAFDEVAGGGLVYDLGPHLIDQAMNLFGMPAQVIKTVTSHRHGSSVPDFFNFQFIYNDGPVVFISSNMLVPHAGPSFIAHGTLGSFYKGRTDVQEQQLAEGMKIDNPEFGKEATDDSGLLVVFDSLGNKINSRVKQVNINYLGLFEAVYQQIVNNVPFPILRQDIEYQLTLLEKKPDNIIQV